MAANNRSTAKAVAVRRRDMRASELISALRRQLDGKISEEIERSSLFVDLVDIREIANWYSSKLEGIASSRRLTRNQLETFLIDLDVQLFDHLNTHLRSLRQHIRVILRDMAKHH